jgi:hypothetical protein
VYREPLCLDVYGKLAKCRDVRIFEKSPKTKRAIWFLHPSCDRDNSSVVDNNRMGHRFFCNRVPLTGTMLQSGQAKARTAEAFALPRISFSALSGQEVYLSVFTNSAIAFAWSSLSPEIPFL